MRALIIDDSKAMRRILTGMLRGLNYEIHEAGDGAAALARLEELGPVELALVDWDMPIMTGLDFVKAVRANPIYDSMQLMMVTAQTELSKVVDALSAGANEYVMKPFTADVIREKLELLQLDLHS